MKSVRIYKFLLRTGLQTLHQIAAKKQSSRITVSAAKVGSYIQHTPLSHSFTINNSFKKSRLMHSSMSNTQFI